ncbi:hypothetical protein [Halostagnicola sp. A-GB9-2]|nr:hypothetical protein [Halostagnicola sp. A-GB9-2]MDJ1434173.1 hypothetical protein [Halostagnicola sp. A-GB9-2]
MGADHIDIEKGEEEVASGVSGRLYTVFALLSMLVAGFAASILFGVLG